jgi:hypothetical protein
MTQPVERLAFETGTTPRRELPPVLWRFAGGLAIAHIVLVLGGASQLPEVLLSDRADVAKQALGAANVGHAMVGGYVESIGVLVLLPVLVFLARAVGRRTEAGRWATQTALAAGVCNVAITLATGTPAGAAALYGAHNGVADAATLALVDNLRNFAFYLSLLALGAHAIGTGIAAVADGTMKGWVGFGGIGVGLVLFAGVAAAGVTNGSSVGLLFIVWMIWWVGLGIALIRRGSAEA